MSFFMVSMPAAGLMSSPPVSKQTPLPTSVTFSNAGGDAMAAKNNRPVTKKVHSL